MSAGRGVREGGRRRALTPPAPCQVRRLSGVTTEPVRRTWRKRSFRAGDVGTDLWSFGRPPPRILTVHVSDFELPAAEVDEWTCAAEQTTD
jgi:hypothetical protein